MCSLAIKDGALTPRSGALIGELGAFGLLLALNASAIAKIRPGCHGLGSALLGEGLIADKLRGNRTLGNECLGCRSNWLGQLAMKGVNAALGLIGAESAGSRNQAKCPVKADLGRSASAIDTAAPTNTGHPANGDAYGCSTTETGH